jgi:hypothetical protein
MANDSPHAQAAQEAADSLDHAAMILRDAYDHPHHFPRLEQVEQLITGLKGLVEGMPQEEVNREEFAGRLLKQYRDRSLPGALPQHADDLLRQELERAGQA